MSDVAVQAPARERSSLTRWTLAVSSVGLFVVTLDSLVVTTALPALAQHFGASVQSLEWSVNAYALGLALALLAGAPLGDRFGHRRVFLLGLTLFTAASTGCALATRVEVFDGARAAQGIGGGLVAALTLTILGSAIAGERRVLAHSLWWGVGGLGVLVGPLVGGALVSQADWRWIFWMNIPVGVAAIAFAGAGLEATRGPRAKLDVAGLALFGAGLGAVVWGVTRGSEIGWTSKQVVPALGAGALWLAALVAWELAAPVPVLPFRAVRRPRQLALGAVSLASSFGLFGTLFVLMQFLQIVQARTAMRAGLATVPLIGAALLLAPVGALLYRRVGSRPLVTVGLGLQAAAVAWFAHVGTVDVAYTRLLPGFVAFGAGIGLVLLPAGYAVLESVRSESTAQACGANVALGAAGGAAGVAAFMAVLLGSGSYASGAAFTDGLVRTLWVGAAVVAGGAFVSLMVPGRRRVAEVMATFLDAPATGDATAEEHADERETLPDVPAGNEVADPESFSCPVCLGHGSIAFQPPIDPRTQTCTRCYGHGKVLTGSHVPAHMVRDCPDCNGRGYVEVERPAVVAPAAEAPAVEAPAIVAPAVVLPAFEAPIVEAPAIVAPAVVLPAFEAPDVEAPDVKAPAVVPPTVEVPGFEAPAVEAPAVVPPTVEVPGFEATQQVGEIEADPESATVGPVIETNLRDGDFPRRTTSGWDELRGRPRPTI